MKLFEEYSKCSIILDEVIPEHQMEEFKKWVSNNNIKRSITDKTTTGFRIAKYTGNMIELEGMIRKWFFNPDLSEKIKCN